MVNRKLTTHEECLRLFGRRFKSTVCKNLAFWESQNRSLAETRAAAYSLVLAELKDAANESGTPLQDIGVEDFDVPKI